MQLLSDRNAQNDLTDLAPQARRAVALKIFNDIETVGMPILTLGIPLHRMHMHRFIALVGVEMEPLTLHIERCHSGCRAAGTYE